MSFYCSTCEDMHTRNCVEASKLKQVDPDTYWYRKGVRDVIEAIESGDFRYETAHPYFEDGRTDLKIAEALKKKFGVKG